MEVTTHRYWLRGARVQTTWSAHVIVKQVLITVKDPQWTFHGVRVSNLDLSLWDRPPSDCLLWVVEDTQGLRAWQECRQRPYLSEKGLEQEAKDIKEVFGYHECEDGKLYFAVRWEGYECPTWEPEPRLASCCIQLGGKWAPGV
ncbi:hypothetical protein BGZ63DRAFT_351236 [Mariannaea sp. PMI_226]|nr:hypothetical protein BGZ63DRAFT_351236 [Mariannaea sp. PMI_226]